MQHNNLCTCNGSDRESHVTDARTEENALQGNEQSTAAAQKASKKVLWQSATSDEERGTSENDLTRASLFKA